jgi:cytochrome c oxidase subunit 2
MMAPQNHLSSLRRLAALSAIVIATTGACGSESEPEVSLSPAAEEGRVIATEAGCDSCHGEQGEGGVGPAYVGLFDSEVPLDTGDTVVADADYLRRSIKDPGAEQVDGYTVVMPPNTLTDEEIDAVIAYIEELK